MRLELADFPVKGVQYGGQTGYNKGVLEVDKEELLALVSEDKRIASANLDVAFPGEQTRITFIRDVVEPRVKVSGPGCVFPGILGPVETVGEGRTHKLSGVTVMASAQYRPTITMGGAAQSAGLVDLWGPGSQVTPYGSLINIVLMLKLIDGVTELEAHSTIQLAELRVARRLAETTRRKAPEIVEVFELFEVKPSLPRVVYNICLYTERLTPCSGVALYGFPIGESLPVFVHPNELLDGAVTVDARKGGALRPHCWAWMNQPTVLELFREHGKRLNFLGILLQRTNFETSLGRQVTAACTSQMASLLRADGAIVTGMAGMGNTFFGAMLTVQGYERKGIKTVFLTLEQGSSRGELPLAFYVPEATAMVSSGDLEHELKVPAPAKVIGCEKSQLMAAIPGDPPFSPWSELTFDMLFRVTGGIDWWGGMNYICKEY